MPKQTKQPHSNNPIATTPYKKGEIVLIDWGIYQWQEAEIYDMEYVAGGLCYQLIIGGCFPAFVSADFLQKKPDHHDEKEWKEKNDVKGESKSNKAWKTSRRSP